jgi:hypothetical protein
VKLAAGISLTDAVKVVAGRKTRIVDEALEAADTRASRRPMRLVAGGARLCAFAVLAVAFLAAAPTTLDAELPTPPTTHRRVALVVGNSTYRHTPRLENPRNDAADMSAALKERGFHVIEGLDLDKAAFDRTVRDFALALQGAEVGLFFYAGHGMQVGGRNYLVPVDARLATVSALDFEMVPLDLVHRTMEREAPVESGVGALVSFSTQPGNVALDGAGRNSPFSGALVRQLAASNEDLTAILIAVRVDVMRQTDRKQVPWENSALTGRFYFDPAAGAPSATTGLQLRSSEAAEAWSVTKDTTNLAVLGAFVSRYRDTFYAELARARIEELKK